MDYVGLVMVLAELKLESIYRCARKIFLRKSRTALLIVSFLLFRFCVWHHLNENKCFVHNFDLFKNSPNQERDRCANASYVLYMLMYFPP